MDDVKRSRSSLKTINEIKVWIPLESKEDHQLNFGTAIDINGSPIDDVFYMYLHHE